MGDLAGKSVNGILYYVARSEFVRILSLNLSASDRAGIVADMCRLNTLYMIARAGSGHIGSSFSSLDILTWLVLEEFQENDIFFSSKGHDAPAYYSLLTGLGKLEFNLIHELRRVNGLPGHPDIQTPGIAANTGSLGMGISKAKGMIFANRLRGRQGRVFVITGDGELQEGQFWESLISASNYGLHELIVVIDHNKLQSDTFVKNVSDLGDLEGKLRSFGWRVCRCDGHDLKAFSYQLAEAASDVRPKVIIADTIKGKGVSFMEHTSLDSDVAMYRFHSGAPDTDSYRTASEEIMARLSQRLEALNEEKISYESLERTSSGASVPTDRLIPAYSEALLAQAGELDELVVLDADLVLDTGLIPFKDKYPERFFECGIAEQDMVSIAGGMALSGLLPVVHSFACFLTSRPNEQIYNNSTEKTRIVYVGSLAGVIPGGPGHSHQAVRDISSLSAIPNLIMVEPSCESEVGALFNWCVHSAPGSSYLRLISIPWHIPYKLPSDYKPVLGHGVTLHEGKDVVVISYGMLCLSSAFEAAQKVVDVGISTRVINLPWLNYVDSSWLKSAVSGFSRVVLLDNHYARGGQGDLIAREIANLRISIEIKFGAVSSIPPCGTNAEVLSIVKLDVDSIVDLICEG